MTVIAPIKRDASLMVQLVKNLPAMWVDLDLIPGSGRYPGEGKDYRLQYSGLENSMDCIYKESDMTERLSLSLFIRCIGPSVNPHSQSIYQVSGNLQNVLHLLL